MKKKMIALVLALTMTALLVTPAWADAVEDGPEETTEATTEPEETTEPVETTAPVEDGGITSDEDVG